MEESLNNSESTHPLLIQSVLQSTMEYLRPSDILKSRLVCQAWNKSSTKILRKTKTIKFRMSYELLEEFTLLMKSSKDFPCSQFELEFYHLNEKPVEEFLTICGKYITSLQLNNCRCTTKELYEILTIKLQNLVKFSINCDPIEENGRNYYCNVQEVEEENNSAKLLLPQLKSLQFVGEFCKNEILIEDLLRYGKNTLKSLRIRCYDVLDEDSTFEKLVFNVFLKTKFIEVQVIEDLQIEFRINDLHLEELQKKQLRNLEFLHINLNETVTSNVLTNLLNSYARTLKRLELDFKLCADTQAVVVSTDSSGQAKAKPTTDGINGCLAGGESESESKSHVKPPTNQYYYYTLPKMYTLTKLSLTNFKGSLDFLNNCKVLKYLTLVNCNVSLQSLKNINIHPNLHSFATILVPKLKSDVLIQIAQLFPNLKELNTDLDENSLKIVFEFIPGLEELYIIGDEINDDNLTGIKNAFELLTIYNIGQDDDDDDDDDDEEEDEQVQVVVQHHREGGGDNGIGKPNVLSLNQILELRNEPSIIRLQKLRKLKLQDASSITDASVIFGLSYCKHLVEISFLNSEVTDTSLETIADNLPNLEKLELLHNLPKFTTTSRNYIQSKLPTCDLILGQNDLLNLYRSRTFGAINSNSNSNSCNSSN